MQRWFALLVRTRACARQIVEVPVRAGARERTYLVADLSTRRIVTQREELRVGWFANAGSFSALQTRVSYSL